MPRRFVVVSGLPCSGKTTLARQLAPALQLAVIDKDDILEELFHARGVGDAVSRRKLSRESDAIFEARAKGSSGAVLVSFWRAPGMPSDSGTPTGWLTSLADEVVEVHCSCPAEIAAERFVRRRRHPGHLDSSRSYDEVLQSLRATPCGGVSAGRRIVVDTSQTVSIRIVLDQLQFR